MATLAANAAARPKSRRRRSRTVLMAALLIPALLGIAWGLAKVGVLPTGAWAAKNPGAGQLLAAIGLSPKESPTAAAQSAYVPPSLPVALPEPVRPSPEPLEMTPPPTPPPLRKDNTARVARILATMDAPEIARIIAGMSDAEAAPLLLKMSERTAGEVLTALPTRRALTLTRYLRRYGGRG